MGWCASLPLLAWISGSPFLACPYRTSNATQRQVCCMGINIFCEMQSPIPPSFHTQSCQADLKLIVGRVDSGEGQKDPLLHGSNSYLSASAEKGKGCLRLTATEGPLECAEHSLL